MSRTYKKIFKFIFAWQDEKEEEWLREMNLKGWKFKKFSWFRYTFEKTEPKDVIYRLDYKSTTNKDIDEYLQIYEDAGWEHVDEFFGWNYFRTDAKDCVYPEIFSDNASKVQKYKGLLKALLIVLGFNFINILNIILNPVYEDLSLFRTIIRIVHIPVMILLGYCSYRVYKKIKQLKQEI